MPTLQIDLEQGFDGDTVVVSADGEEVWRAEGVTTNLSSNVAAIAQVDVPEGAEVEVAVPTRDLATSERIEKPYLVVRTTPDGLDVRQTDELPRYL